MGSWSRLVGFRCALELPGVARAWGDHRSADRLTNGKNILSVQSKISHGCTQLTGTYTRVGARSLSLFSLSPSSSLSSCLLSPSFSPHPLSLSFSNSVSPSSSFSSLYPLLHPLLLCLSHSSFLSFTISLCLYLFALIDWRKTPFTYSVCLSVYLSVSLCLSVSPSLSLSLSDESNVRRNTNCCKYELNL